MGLGLFLEPPLFHLTAHSRREGSEIMAEDINQSITDLQAAIVAATAGMKDCCKTGGVVVDGPPMDTTDVDIGIEGQFETQEEYQDAKCNVSNAIFDTIEALIDWLDANNVDLIGGQLGGMTSGLAAACLIVGPVGWAWVVTASVIGGLTWFILKAAVDFGDISAALGDMHEECVKALYNSSSADQARDAFVFAMASSSSYPTTSTEQAFVRLLVGHNLGNELFNPRQDSVVYQSPQAIDCTDSELQVWTFTSSNEGFTFSDESVSPSSADGNWVVGIGGWEIELETVTSPAGPRATGRITKSGLSIAVTTANSVQMDFGAVDDNINISHRITVTYSDMTDQTVNKSQKGAGTVIVNCDGSKTINKVELDISRSYDYQPSSPDVAILEARVQ